MRNYQSLFRNIKYNEIDFAQNFSEETRLTFWGKCKISVSFFIGFFLDLGGFFSQSNQIFLGGSLDYCNIRPNHSKT